MREWDGGISSGSIGGYIICFAMAGKSEPDIWMNILVVSFLFLWTSPF